MTTPLLDQVKSFYGSGWSEKVKMRSSENTENLLNKIVSAGPNSLQVIMDFDQTLTCYTLKNGKRCMDSYRVIANSPLVSSKITDGYNQLEEKYLPIAIDTSKSVEERTSSVIQWKKESHDLFLTSPLTHSELLEMVKNAESELRVNSPKLFKTLRNSEIPTLILSAGLGNVVEESLKLNSVKFPNVEVISNFMQFNESGVLSGFSEFYVHAFGKNKSPCHFGYFKPLKTRRNVILMGDIVEDAKMAAGMGEADVLKIGFLNHHIQDRLESFLEVFDVVLVDDQTMDFANSIMQLVVK